VPRENVIGRPLFNYWSFKSTDEDYEQTGPGSSVAWMAHIVKHFVPDTRWSRTLHVVR
jgi:signal peptidase I